MLWTVFQKVYPKLNNSKKLHNLLRESADFPGADEGYTGVTVHCICKIVSSSIDLV